MKYRVLLCYFNTFSRYNARTQRTPNKVNIRVEQVETGLFKSHGNEVEKGLIASYKVLKLIANCGKLHTIGETLIIPAVKEIISTMMPTQKDITPSIPLSNSSVSSRIDEMASDIENELYDELKTTQFSLQLDETTLRDNEALILAYVRYINSSHAVVEEFLFAEKLEVDTKGSTVYKAVEQFFKQKGIPLSNVIACATDGAPSMVGRHRGFIAHLKREVPDIFTIHCVIHRQHLAAKHLSDRLHSTLQAVIKAVNRIKAHSSNDRIFRQLCHENEEEFEQLLLHTEVRWLSKGNCLRRFYDLYDSVLDFFKCKLLDEKISTDLENRRADVAYLSDIFNKLNEVNIKLQGTKMCLIKAKGIIMAFISKLDFYKSCLLRPDLNQFPSLKALKENQTDDSCLSDTDLDCYSSHLQALKEDMMIRFKDLKELKIPEWVVNPFQADATNADPNLVEELIDLQNDIEGKVLFQQIGYEAFWPKEQDKYPHLWKKIKLLLLAFPSSYLVEKGFSVVLQLLTKQRNRLQICKRGDLRLCLSNIEPDIIKLASSHQAQGSH
ncbi:SCAN domain-containing protein 3-like [Palaemon carinicauda]|uniref:SCAN domain-containing protein 3-like n=1 Tax=Palaemon carinicauda TaxID=392227 RepID=UPI0035B5BF79